MPLHHDPLTSEPYIRLPHPLSHIILTPPRLHPGPSDPEERATKDIDERRHTFKLTPPAADISAVTTALNDVRVYDWLESPPFPYTASHAEDFMRRGYEDCQRILSAAAAAAATSADSTGMKAWVDGCPFRDIRDTSSSSITSTISAGVESAGEGDVSVSEAKKIGDIMLSRYTFYEIQPAESEQRRLARERNAALAPGDERVKWGVGFWLSPTYHKQGIMTAALQTILTEWAIPRMNVRVVMGSAFVGNHGSVAVMQKCGFEVQEVIEKGSVELSESRGGGKRDIYVLRWERPDTS